MILGVPFSVVFLQSDLLKAIDILFLMGFFLFFSFDHYLLFHNELIVQISNVENEMLKIFIRGFPI